MQFAIWFCPIKCKRGTSFSMELRFFAPREGAPRDKSSCSSNHGRERDRWRPIAKLAMPLGMPATVL